MCVYKERLSFAGCHIILHTLSPSHTHTSQLSQKKQKRSTRPNPTPTQKHQQITEITHNLNERNTFTADRPELAYIVREPIVNRALAGVCAVPSLL